DPLHGRNGAPPRRQSRCPCGPGRRQGRRLPGAALATGHPERPRGPRRRPAR
ncbi:MAG: hypothetical protein AVDCRST_MAG47-3208, partial [uncultured Nocardioidaceae bacterium]